MRKRVAILLVIVMVLSLSVGCSGGENNISEKEYGNLCISVEVKKEGISPINLTTEEIYFASDEELPEVLKAANETQKVLIEEQWSNFSNYSKEGFDYCKDNGIEWCDIYAYPMNSERYLNSVISINKNQFFTKDIVEPWRSVSTVVYDCQEDVIVELSDACEMEETSPEKIYEDICDFILNTMPAEPEGLDSMGFFITIDGMVQFIASVELSMISVYGTWTEFFIWSNGEVRYIGLEPMEIYYPDILNDNMYCAEIQRQYMSDDYLRPYISKMQALETLKEIAEVQEYIDDGMIMLFDGDIIEANGKVCWSIALGREENGEFIREIYYAVTENTVYMLDQESIEGEWVPVAFG